ncbi:SGNH/GDSL hydrolase family protein [Asticcacaulis sp. AC402]|uniref:SGNH/GDSL hydrolase family protein n=1 Tax=Asticcacaulis sp. AC402 TaxID=1282361 RepID=UPI0003C3F242|nr:SGNH/GDSL hydrolase family protein [Asticcacaulis sp. AC402]ESQ74705.1 hypothetical protein ABAC402_12425 [Asticcacaulis sp. AC402]
MQKPTIKAIVIGGSNTIIKDNYLFQTFKALKALRFELDIIENLAVGGTTTFNGLYGLKRSDKLADADVLIIEYALNDTPTFSDDTRIKGMANHWARAYEGVIRYAREVNPNIRIISIVLESMTKPEARRFNMINAGIHYLTNYYNLEIIDIASDFLRRVGQERAATKEFYKDANHYKPPVVFDIAKKLARQLTGDYPAPRPLPDPLDPMNLSAAQAIGTEVFETELTPFSNSRFTIDTIELANQDLRFTLERGKLLALFYVDQMSSGVGHFSVNGEAFAAYMRKPGVRSGTYPWLMGMISTEFLHPKNLMAEEEDRAYTLSVEPQGIGVKPFRPAANVANQPTDAPTLAFYGLLHTGKMTHLDLVPRQMAHAAE